MNLIKLSCGLIALPLAISVLCAEQLRAQTAAATPEQLVNALNGVFGVHPGFRAVHAKGIVLEGSFTPSATATSVSKAPHFQNVSVPVTIRFSNFAGVPTIADADPLASPHGMALKFHLPDGSETDIVTISYNGFPAATADEFLALLIALGTSGSDAPKPTPLDKFLADHPIAKAYLGGQNPPPVSFATLPYFGVNSFKFTNVSGNVTFGRYEIRPVADTQFLSKEDAAKAAPDYLMDEIRQRIGKGPIEFKLLVQVAEKDDEIANPSIAWPQTRKTVELGTIAITKAVEDSDAAQRKLLFLPSAVPTGIEPADPMIDVRSGAYAVSYSRRSQ